MDTSAEIALLRKENAALHAENALLRERISSLEEKVLLLLEQLSNVGKKKDSRNSHNPPSQDKYKPKRNNSLRKPSERKSGGQKGRTGRTLLQSPSPDKTEHLKSDYCEKCGEDLRGAKHELVSKRQVVELPPIAPIYLEYRQYGTQCSCGHHQKASYPQGVNAPIQYGNSVVTLVSYFNVYQYVAYQRLSQLFKDVFSLSISEGSIENLLNKAARKATPVYEHILELLQESSYLGSDETGAKVNGEKWWIWVWQNVNNTFLKASVSRGFDTVKGLFPKGLLHTIIGSDRWAAQLKIESKSKQLCTPHLQRDLNFLEEKEQHAWVMDFKTLLKDALVLRHQAEQRGQAYSSNDPKAKGIEKRLDQLLLKTISQEQYPKTYTFQKSMIKYRNYLFQFLYNLEVPPDNNASERAIRNIKVKQKVSGQFKSGQHTFCVLRSIIDTLRKRKLNVLEHLQLIMKLST
ncbi:MAG: IS66 family transposase [Bacteroidota bacterium]